MPLRSADCRGAARPVLAGEPGDHGAPSGDAACGMRSGAVQPCHAAHHRSVERDAEAPQDISRRRRLSAAAAAAAATAARLRTPARGSAVPRPAADFATPVRPGRALCDRRCAPPRSDVLISRSLAAAVQTVKRGIARQRVLSIAK